MKLNTSLPLETPVLLLAFNRPEKTALVFESIRQVRPRKLYVAVDAPRQGRPDDVEKNKKVKEIVQNVDWPCETHYLFHDKNLGCSLSGFTAWSWIFETEDRIIFVEDDGLGSPAAFYFVQEMLERYKDNPDVSYIGGVNYGPKYGNASYFFSRIPTATYFMGTWRRVFKQYEYNIDSFQITNKTKEFHNAFVNWQERIVFNQQFRSYRKSVIKGQRHNTYDVQMTYLAYKYHTYSIYPNKNLVSNIGLDGGANNASDPDSDFYKEYANRPTEIMGEIIHPTTIGYDSEFEAKFFRKRALYSKPWYNSYLKSLFLQYYGSFYRKHIKPIRRRQKNG